VMRVLIEGATSARKPTSADQAARRSLAGFGIRYPKTLPPSCEFWLADASKKAIRLADATKGPRYEGACHAARRVTAWQKKI